MCPATPCPAAQRLTWNAPGSSVATRWSAALRRPDLVAVMTRALSLMFSLMRLASRASIWFTDSLSCCRSMSSVSLVQVSCCTCAARGDLARTPSAGTLGGPRALAAGPTFSRRPTISLRRRSRMRRAFSLFFRRLRKRRRGRGASHARRKRWYSGGIAGRRRRQMSECRQPLA
jgi:hypothetical protein